MKIKNIIAYTALCTINSLAIEPCNLSKLPPPYCNLKQLLPPNGHSFYLNASCLEKLCQHNKISTVIEIGSWLGASTRHIASLLPNNGHLYAVDTWLGSVEHSQNPSWEKLLPTLYEQFLSNTIHAQLTDKIIPIRMTSLQAAIALQSLMGKVDLIYIDAAHDTESVLADLNAYYPFIVNKSGILCGDDWMYPDVKKAVIQFAQQHNLSVYWDYNFWFMKEENNHIVDDVNNYSKSIWNVI